MCRLLIAFRVILSGLIIFFATTAVALAAVPAICAFFFSRVHDDLTGEWEPGSRQNATTRFARRCSNG